MNQAMVDWAITAIDFGEDTTRAEQWFKVLASSYQDPDAPEPVGNWDEFVERLKPAAEREGFDSASVEYFVESLKESSSDPIGDVVLPLYEQQDSLPQEYLDLHAAQAVDAAQTAEAEEQKWTWDDAQQLWLHYEDDQWVPQSQNGYALNHDRTEWVPIEAAAPAEQAAGTDEPLPAGSAEESGQVSNERLESFQAVADDPAVESINQEVLDALLKDPGFAQRMAQVEAEVDAEVDAAVTEALAEVESS